MIRLIFLTSVLLLAVVAFLFLSEGGDSLGDNYYYLPEYEAIDMGFHGGAVIYRSKRKNLFSDIKIQGNIINVSHNSEFLIAIQQQVDSFGVKKENFVTKDPNKVLNYFIIDKDSGTLFGPYTKEQYILKRNQISVPTDLDFKTDGNDTN